MSTNPRKIPPEVLLQGSLQGSPKHPPKVSTNGGATVVPTAVSMGVTTGCARLVNFCVFLTPMERKPAS